MTDLALLAAAVVVFGLISRRLQHSILTAPMFFVAGGIVLGPSGVGLLDLSLNSESVLFIAEVTLVLVLFSDAARIDLGALRHNASLPARLLGLGFPLTLAAGTVVALPLFSDLAFWEAAILAAVLAPTDAALGQVVITSRAVPARIRQALNVESGLNDGLSVPFLTLFVVAAIVEEQLQPASFWLQFAGEQIGYGILVGIVVGGLGGYVLTRATNAGWVSGTFLQLAPVALAVIAWAAADQIGGNGFIAAFVGGLALGRTTKACHEPLLDFSEDEGQLLNLATFFIFGAIIAGPALDQLTWEIVLYAVLSLTVVRMVPVAISMIGTGLRPSSVAFMGWFGPRGIATIVLVLVVLEEETSLAGSDEIFLITAATVLLSVFAHGATAAPLSRLYGNTATGMRESEPEMADVPEVPTRIPMLDGDQRATKAEGPSF